ncbi:MAG: 30S ribosomal protein S8 [Candidatus Bathyarchaeia archaeon]
MTSDPLANALNAILNDERRNKRECMVTPATKLIGQVLRIMQLHGYLGEIEHIDDGRFGKYRIQLLGRINECKAIRPRYPVTNRKLTDLRRRYLPSRDLGILIVSTSKGLMTSDEVESKGLGGLALAYVW